MKILFIGGTGNISLTISRKLLSGGHDLWLLNRSGSHAELAGAKFIKADIGSSDLPDLLAGHEWDVVVDWIAFGVKDVERDISLFSARTKQYVFISSASCYQNPGPTPVITERTPLENPFWQYSRDKIAAERTVIAAHEKGDFQATIVRPSLTYDRVLPLTIGGWTQYTVADRMKRGEPVVVQGDGTSVWTVTHADDFASGLIGLLGNPAAMGEDFHITTDEFLSWNEIYQLTAKALGKEAKIVHVTSDKICELDPGYRGTLWGDKAVSAIFDNSKIKKAVPEFRCEIPYSEGIKRTIDWFEADPSRQILNAETERFIERLIATTRS